MSVNLSPVAGAAAQFLDNSGNVLTGGKLYTYAAGTTTPQATYTSGAGVTFHSNPIILDASGRVPAGGEIWLTDGLQYKFVLKDANDVLIGTWDNLIGINSNFLNFYTQEETQTATQGQTVFTLATVTYSPGANNLSVYVNGSKQIATVNYVETDSTTVTFLTGLNVGDVVDFTTAVTLSSGVTNASLVVYNQGDTDAVDRTVELKLQEQVSVKDFGAVGDGITDDTAAIQACINASVGITSLTQQSTHAIFQVYLPAGNYKVSTLYLPRNTNMVGSGYSTRFTTTSAAAVLVIGRSLAESDWVQVNLKDFQIYGNMTGSGQVGIRALLTGAGGYIYKLQLENIYIRDMHTSGIFLTSTDAAGMLLYTIFKNVQCVNSNGYGLYTRFNVFNLANFVDCSFSENLLGGVFIDYFGSGSTAPAETIKFQNCSFESNGNIIGGVQTGTGVCGFQSAMYQGQYEFDTCYFEGNGYNLADTTGCNIKVQNAWNLTVLNTLLVSSNNQICMYKGGFATVDGCFIGTTSNFVFLIDGARVGTAYSRLTIGKNKYSSSSLASNLIAQTNGAWTFVDGYNQGVQNYLAVTPRIRNSVYKNNENDQATYGSIGYTGTKRLRNTIDGTEYLSNTQIGRICKNTIYTMLILTNNYGNEMALFLVAGSVVKLVSQSGTHFSTVAGTPNSLNVYNDGGSGYIVAENLLGGTAVPSARFVAVESMLHNDDGYYEAQFES